MGLKDLTKVRKVTQYDIYRKSWTARDLKHGEEQIGTSAQPLDPKVKDGPSRDSELEAHSTKEEDQRKAKRF